MQDSFRWLPLMHEDRTSHAGSDGGSSRSSAISRKISWNISRGIATSAIWTRCSDLAHHLGADLDQLLLEGGQRPITHRFRRRQRPQEVGEVVGKRTKQTSP